jgi:hypothetical protein
MLIIDLFIPWQSIKRCIVSNQLLKHARIEHIPVQRVICPSGGSIERRAIMDVYPYEQYLIVANDYEKKDEHGVPVATELEKMYYSWYYRYEMVYLLEQAGFSTVRIIDYNEEMIAYQAILL